MSEYCVVPPGHRTGCLPRTTKPGEWCPLFGSRIKVIPRSDWATYTGKVSLRPFVREVLNQGRVGSCFPPGTMIRLANGGEKAIDNISVLDEVVTAEGNVGKVTQVMARQHNDVVLRLCINGSHHVRCTPEHPILTQRGYVPAGELIKGDMVAFPKDDKCLWRRFESVEEEPYDGYVFNLEVEGDHSYVAEGIGVHNCASESSTQSLMIIRAFAGLPHISLNPYFVYHTVSGGRDQGSTIDGNLKFMREVGCAPISVWPRSQDWQRRPSAEAVEAAKPFRIVEFYEIRTVEEMVTALFLGFPVVYGANGHAVVKIEHLNDREGLDINSWGTGWGDGGFGVWAPYSMLGSSLQYGAFAVRTSLQNDMLFDVERAAI